MLKRLSIQESSNVRVVLYDDECHQLLVLFRSGGLYLYHTVAPDVALGFERADSAGRYFAENVKGIVPGERID